MAISYIDSHSGFISGNGSLTVPIPATAVAGDLLLLFVESANQAITTPAGWTECENSPQFTGTAAAAGGVRLGVYWKWWDGYTPTIVDDTGNHTTACIVGFRGVGEIHSQGTNGYGVKSSATGTSVILSDVQTVSNTVVVWGIALDADSNSTNQVTAWSSPLTTIEILDQTINTGVGGGLAISYAESPSGGSISNQEATLAQATTAAFISVVLRPPQLDRYWVGGSGNINDPAHWSLESGGAGGASAPTIANKMWFDSNSGSVGHVVTVNATTQVASLNMVGWVGALEGTQSLVIDLPGTDSTVRLSSTGMYTGYTGNIFLGCQAGIHTLYLQGQTLGCGLVLTASQGSYLAISPTVATLRDLVLSSQVASHIFADGSVFDITSSAQMQPLRIEGGGFVHLENTEIRILNPPVGQNYSRLGVTGTLSIDGATKIEWRCSDRVNFTTGNLAKFPLSFNPQVGGQSTLTLYQDQSGAAKLERLDLDTSFSPSTQGKLVLIGTGTYEVSSIQWDGLSTESIITTDAAVATLHLLGGGQEAVTKCSINRITASPASTWTANNCTDVGANSGWTWVNAGTTYVGTVSGGVQSGGAATTLYHQSIRSYTGSGGINSSGTSPYSALYYQSIRAYTPSGGVTASGAATYLPNWRQYTGTGTATFGTPSTPRWGKWFKYAGVPVTGGCLFSGTAPKAKPVHVHVYVPAVQGGIQAIPNAVTTLLRKKAKAYAGSGSLVGAGAATVGYKVRRYTASGGASFNGVAETGRTINRASTCAISFTGKGACSRYRDPTHQQPIYDHVYTTTGHIEGILVG